MKYRFRIITFVGLVTALLGFLSFNAVGLNVANAGVKVYRNLSGSNVCGQWNVVPSPDGNGNSGLRGVAALNSTNIWAVGGSGSQRSTGQTLIEHWNGTAWSVVASPNPGLRYDALNAVTIISSTNAWAVGFSSNDGQTTQTLIEHWNGKQWLAVKSPNPGSLNNELYSISATSASDIWAVGFISTTLNQNPVDRTLIEHWNGTSWSVVKSPNPGPATSSYHLSGVTAISANDAWAVGNTNTSNTGHTVVEHWNGTGWSAVKSPSPGSGGTLTGVTAISAADIWAVGYTDVNGTIQTLTEHWNGSTWNVVKSVNVGQHPSFWAVTAIASDDVWAVGSDGSATLFDQTLIEHWNGKQWSVVASPSPGSSASQLEGVAAASATNVWAVGYADSNTLTEQYHC